MRTKYLRTHSGLFTIFHEGIGIDHSMMADHVEDARNVGDAGFVADQDGSFCIYGSSISLGVQGKQETGKLMDEALATGEIRLYPFRDDWLATNAHLPGDFKVAKNMADLHEHRIFKD